MTTPFIKKDLHIGIYGILENNNSLLVVRKSRGPYIGLFDLPGGRPNHGEPLLEALRREIKEETGIDAKEFSQLGNFSFLIFYQHSEDKSQRELYHIALLYLVKLADLSSFNPSIYKEDANGSLWIAWSDSSKKNSSPLLIKALEIRPLIIS